MDEDLINGTTEFLGTGFLIDKKRSGRCLFMTCEHVIRDYYKVRGSRRLWIRLHEATMDLECEVLCRDKIRDIAILMVRDFTSNVIPTLPRGPKPLKFKKTTRIGKVVVLLGYFNPPNVCKVIGVDEPIACEPASIPGRIVGPLKKVPRRRPWARRASKNYSLRHSCYGIGGRSGAPIIRKGQVIGMFDGSLVQVHQAIPTITIKAALKDWMANKGMANGTLDQMIARL